MKNPASIGQAINLAAADARQENKKDDVSYIYKRFVFWSVVCEAIQAADLEMIQEVIDKKDLDKKIRELLK